MSEQTASLEAEAKGEGEDAGEGEGQARTSRRWMPGKKLVLFAGLPLLLLLGLAAGAYLTGLADPLLGRGKSAEQELLAKQPAGPAVYYELPDMLVNLNSSGRRTGYLKLSVSLELGSEKDKERIEQALPRVIDNFQVYLRELRIEDLQGSAGLQRLREELLLRVSAAAHPAVVRDVLFQEMLIQ